MFHTVYVLLSADADMQGVDISFTVCLFVSCVFISYFVYGYGFLCRG